MKKYLIIGVNIIIMFAYLIIVRVQQEDGMDILVVAFWMFMQVLINLIIGLVLYFTDHKEQGKKFLLSALLVLLIGFPTCWTTFAN